MEGSMERFHEYHVPDGSGEYCEFEVQLSLTIDMNYDSHKELLTILLCPLV